MKLSLINVDTITDAKLPTLNEVTMHDHATFLTQTDINSEQHRKMIEYDDNYIWNFIPKNDQEKKCRQRVAIRIPRNCREDIFFEPVEHSYIIGIVKKSIKDPSGAQWYLEFGSKNKAPTLYTPTCIPGAHAAFYPPYLAPLSREISKETTTNASPSEGFKNTTQYTLKRKTTNILDHTRKKTEIHQDNNKISLKIMTQK